MELIPSLSKNKLQFVIKFCKSDLKSQTIKTCLTSMYSIKQTLWGCCGNYVQTNYVHIRLVLIPVVWTWDCWSRVIFFAFFFLLFLIDFFIFIFCSFCFCFYFVFILVSFWSILFLNFYSFFFHLIFFYVFFFSFYLAFWNENQLKTIMAEDWHTHTQHQFVRLNGAKNSHNATGKAIKQVLLFFLKHSFLSY